MEGGAGPPPDAGTAGLESQELDGPESGSEDADDSQGSFAWDDLWTEAYQTLKDDPEHSDMLEAFEKYVVDGKDASQSGTNKALRHPRYSGVISSQT